MLLDGDAGESIYNPMPFKLADHTFLDKLPDTRRGLVPRSLVDGLQCPGRRTAKLTSFSPGKFPASSRVGFSISQQLIIEPDGSAGSPVLAETYLEGFVYPGSLSLQPLRCQEPLFDWRKPLRAGLGQAS